MDKLSLKTRGLRVGGLQKCLVLKNSTSIHKKPRMGNDDEDGNGLQYGQSILTHLIQRLTSIFFLT